MKLLKISLTPPLTAISAVLCATVSFSAFGQTFTVNKDGSGDYTSIADAVSAANASADAASEVVVYPGLYEVAAHVEVTGPVKIVGQTGNRGDVVIYTAANDGIFILSNTAAELNSLTISNGIATATCLGAGVTLKDGGTVDNCVIKFSRQVTNAGNGAVYNKNGVIRNSVIHDNLTAKLTPGVYQAGASAVTTDCVIYNNHFAAAGNSGVSGSGVYMEQNAGLVRNCVITNNQCHFPSGRSGAGGGIFIVGNGCTVENCLIANNRAAKDGGGGVHGRGNGSVVRNCTIVDNYAFYNGGVGSNGDNNMPTMIDCIVWGNGETVENNQTAKQLRTLGATPLANLRNLCTDYALGTGGLAADPLFADSVTYALTKDSPCIGAGENGGDLGWKPYAPSAFEVGLSFLGVEPLDAGDIVFTATARGTDATDVTCSFKVDDGAWGDYSAETALTATLAAGLHTVAVRAKNGAGTVVESSRSVRIAAEKVYLSKTSTPAPPYSTPETAADDFKEALRYCGNGTVLHLFDGDYGVMSDAIVARTIRIETENGPEKTSVYAACPRDSEHVSRVARFTCEGTEVVGLTLSNGWYNVSAANQRKGTVAEQRVGGLQFLDSGVNASAYGTVFTNCVFTKAKVPTFDYCGATLLAYSCRIYNSKIIDNSVGGALGGGLNLDGSGSLVQDSVIASNIENSNSDNGAGINLVAGDVIRCVITNNVTSKATTTAGGGGGGIYVAGNENPRLIADCLIANNKAATSGGGGICFQNQNVNNVRIVNCTIVDNVGAVGGGINFNVNAAESTKTGNLLANCVFWGNTSANAATAPDYANADRVPGLVVSNCCFSSEGQKMGANPQAGDPLFVTGTYWPSATSAFLRDVGFTSADLHGGFDLTGGVRVVNGAVDIGCVEFVPDEELSCSYAVTGLDEPGAAVVATARVDGSDAQKVGLQYRWCCTNVVTGACGGWTAWSDSPTQVFADMGIGHCRIFLEIVNGAGETAASDGDGAVFVKSAAQLFLAAPGAEGIEPTYPYGTAQTAATNVHDVAVLAGAGTEIFVGAGDYLVTNEIVFLKKVILRGECGPSVTSFYEPRNVSAENAYRLFDFQGSGDLVYGIAFSNGWSSGSGTVVRFNDATVSNCVFTGGRSSSPSPMNSYASAVYLPKGLISHCRVEGNVGVGIGGLGLYVGPDAVAEWCVIRGNSADQYYGCGGVSVEGGIVRNCEITDNVNMRRDYNGAGNEGGGVTILGGGTVINSLIARNKAGSSAGIRVASGGVKKAEGPVVINCTVVSNTCVGPYAAGLSAQAANSGLCVTNTIFWGNYSTGKAAVCEVDVKGTYDHSVVDETALAEGSVVTECFYADPKFRNYDRGNYRIKGTGPCRDAGADIEWPADAKDLDGNGRVKFSHVDIGCYECQTAGMLLLVR